MQGYVTLRWRRPPLSVHLHRRTLAVVAGLALVTSAAVLAALATGSLTIPPARVLRTLTGSGLPQDVFVIQTLRLPRVLVGMMVGAALGLSGALLQALFRNPLAAPDLLGVTGGASVAAVAFLTYGQALSIRWLPPIAFTGAIVVALLIHLLAWKGGAAALRLILVGIGFKAATTALTTLFIVKSPIYLTSRAMLWLTGSVYGTTWADVGLIAPWLGVLGLLAWSQARHVDVLQLGDEVAGGLGGAPHRRRTALLLLAAALSGCAVAVGGAIGFVALLAPHIARWLVGPGFMGLVPAAALTGGLMVVVADTVGRTAFAPLDVPVGVLTSAVGAPFFLYLLYRQQRR